MRNWLLIPMLAMLSGCGTELIGTTTRAVGDTYDRLLAGAGFSGPEAPQTAPTTQQTQDAADLPFQPICPPVRISPEQAHYAVYPRGSEPREEFALYQGSIYKTARECHVVANVATVKLGIAGRALIGPTGRAGTVQLPLWVRLKAPGGAELWRKSYRIPVTIEAGERSGYFVHVEDAIQFPANPDADFSGYVVEVGFSQKR